MYVGFCITAWAKIDEQLFDICLKSLGARKEPVAIVYYRTPGIDARLKLADELARSVLPKRVRKNGGHDHRDVKLWTALFNDVDSLLPIRRRIAHQPVNVKHSLSTRFSRDEGKLRVVGIDVQSSFEIYVSEGERLRGREASAKPLTIDDLSIHCTRVQQLAERLRAFSANALAEHAKLLSQPKSAPDRD